MEEKIRQEEVGDMKHAQKERSKNILKKVKVKNVILSQQTQSISAIVSEYSMFYL